MDEPPDTEDVDHATRESAHRPGDGAQSWLGLLIVVVCAVGSAVVIFVALMKSPSP